MSKPYLDALTAERTELRGKVEAVRTKIVAEKRPMTETEKTETEAHRARLAEVEAEIPAVSEELTRVASVDALRAQIFGGADLASTPESLAAIGGEGGLYAALNGHTPLPSLVPSGTQVVEMLRAAGGLGSPEPRTGRWTVAEPDRTHLRAAVTVANAAGTPSAPATHEPRPVRRFAAQAGLPVLNVAGVTAASFPVFGSGDSAAIVSEGGTKPEYDAVTAGSATPQMISVWSSYTTQTGITVPNYEALLRRKLAARIARIEDKLIADTVSGTTGVQTYQPATDQAYGKSLLAAQGKVLSSDVGDVGTWAMINPADLVAIMGDAVGSTGESPESTLRLTLHALGLYVTTGVAAGAAIVGAFGSASSMVVGMAPTYLVDPFTLMTTNVVRIRAEEAVALAVDEPEGFCVVTFDGAA